MLIKMVLLGELIGTCSKYDLCIVFICNTVLTLLVENL